MRIGAHVDIYGILASDLYQYPEMLYGDQSCGLFTIMLGADANPDLPGCFEEADLTIPVHIWSAEVLNYLKIRIKKGSPISVRGKISMFGDRLLVSVNNKNDITFMHSSVSQAVIRPQNNNKNRQRLALACTEEDKFMAQLNHQHY